MADRTYFPDCKLLQQASPVPTLRCCSSPSGQTAGTQLQTCCLLYGLRTTLLGDCEFTHSVTQGLRGPRLQSYHPLRGRLGLPSNC